MRDWKEVAIDGERHVKRLIDMYEELGFEIRLEEVDPEEVKHCTQCLRQTGEKIYRVYARRKEEGKDK
jgi:branched-subunit amino acid aminotransferase/4-amino-4-deoxychorismate lyase